jgi:hypothetical protein
MDLFVYKSLCPAPGVTKAVRWKSRGLQKQYTWRKALFLKRIFLVWKSWKYTHQTEETRTSGTRQAELV